MLGTEHWQPGDDGAYFIDIPGTSLEYVLKLLVNPSDTSYITDQYAVVDKGQTDEEIKMQIPDRVEFEMSAILSAQKHLSLPRIRVGWANIKTTNPSSLPPAASSDTLITTTTTSRK